MAISSQPTGFNGRIAGISNWVFKALSQLVANFSTTAKSVLRALQTARMMSVLANMSDQQLASIGISRSEIPQYAEKLIADEQGGL